MATSPAQRVPDNSPGDFYVERGVCLRCCLPHREAPELLNDPNVPFGECYFRRQPQNDAEVEQACQAVRVSCVGGPRYGGNDPKVLARLHELGADRQCDHFAEAEPARSKRFWWQRLFGGMG